MRVGLICPYRNDRPKFLEQFHRLLERQTLKPSIVEVVDYVPESFSVDITQRYRRGYDVLRGKDLDVIAFMEVDDWYSPNYLELMVREWDKLGRPKMYGLDYTFYYHLLVGKSFTFRHPDRSSAMSTLIRPDLDVKWCRDDYAYTDAHLWKEIGGKTGNPKEVIAIGLKHGIGMCGGLWHKEGLDRYKSTELDFNKIVGEEDYAFYKGLYPDNVYLKQTKDRGLVISYS